MAKCRNINVVCLWMHVVASPKFSYTTIDHKYMIPGHYYLPNDRDFGSIEKVNRRYPHIFVPQDWATLVENARGRNPFSVTLMARLDFVYVCWGHSVKDCVPKGQHVKGESGMAKYSLVSGFKGESISSLLSL